MLQAVVTLVLLEMRTKRFELIAESASMCLSASGGRQWTCSGLLLDALRRLSDSSLNGRREGLGQAFDVIDQSVLRAPPPDS